jgi:ribosomal protein L29
VGETRRDAILKAARIVGGSIRAIRRRIKRGSSAHTRVESGPVYVFLGSGVDESTNEVSHSESEALISELRSHNDTLREQLASERAQLASEREANRHVIDALIRRIAELEAPQNREPSVQSVGTPDSASRDRKPPDQVEKNSEGPPRPGGDPVMPRSTILASLVPLPKEYLRNPRDGRVQNTAMAREIAEEEGARSGAASNSWSHQESQEATSWGLS